MFRGSCGCVSTDFSLKSVISLVRPSRLSCILVISIDGMFVLMVCSKVSVMLCINALVRVFSISVFPFEILT